MQVRLVLMGNIWLQGTVVEWWTCTKEFVVDVLRGVMPMLQIVVHVIQIFQGVICVKIPVGVLLVRMGITWI